MLDLFAGRLGWSKAFLARGWKVTAVDLVEPPEIPEGVEFIRGDVLHCSAGTGWVWVISRSCEVDFICVSSPCEEFSKHGLRCFYPSPSYPDTGIKLFNHARAICEESGIPYVMENVRAAQQFVGKAVHHCGSFYLWGNAVPPILPQGIKKGLQLGNSGFAGREQIEYRKNHSNPGRDAWSGSKKRADATAAVATIPPELATCVAEYAERICCTEVRA